MQANIGSAIVSIGFLDSKFLSSWEKISQFSRLAGKGAITFLQIQAIFLQIADTFWQLAITFLQTALLVLFHEICHILV